MQVKYSVLFIMNHSKIAITRAAEYTFVWKSPNDYLALKPHMTKVIKVTCIKVSSASHQCMSSEDKCLRLEWNPVVHQREIGAEHASNGCENHFAPRQPCFLAEHGNAAMLLNN